MAVIVPLAFPDKMAAEAAAVVIVNARMDKVVLINAHTYLIQFFIELN